ncbi:MAG: dockerin type I repeat-containing protein [Clostridia bacterium]|nr:dockerin type I repeat-containing protein [Clostridia bacterium]
MKKAKKGVFRILSIVLCSVMMLGIVPFGFSQQATATNANDASVFLHQPKDGDSTCVFTSCLNMFRRRAIIDGDSGWETITHNNYKNEITTNGVSVRFTITNVRGMNASMNSSLTSDKKGYFISMLNNHPEGIVIYCGSSPMHTVLLTDYDGSTDTFYCAETLSSFGYGRIPLTSCYLSTYNGGLSQNGVISKISQIWCITNRSGGSIDPPTPPTASTNKKLYGIGESATFSFSANGATSLHLYIYLNGSLNFEGEFNPSQTYSRYLSATGHYAYYIIAHYPGGNVESGWDDFDVVQDLSDYIPAKPDVWTGTGEVAVNDEVQIFHWSEKATSYLVSIYKDGVWQYAQTHYSSSFTTSFTSAGSYSIAVQAINEYGESAWNSISITVYVPALQTPDVWADTYTLTIDQSVTVYHWADKAAYYVVAIYKDGIRQSVATHYTSSFETSFSSAGNYSIAVQAVNSSGESGWKSITITVYAPVPQKSDVWAGAYDLPINQSVTVYHWSEKATSYLVSVYKDGIWQYDEMHYTSSFTTSFSTAGNYSIAVQAINDYGGSEWNTVSISVYDETVVATPTVEPGFDGVVINEESHCIYGLSAGAAQNCVAVTDGTAAYEYSNTKQALGTGTKVDIYNNDNMLVDSYTVVVFGDIDGDGWYNGTDAYYVSLLANGLIPQTALTDAQRTACDANHDGVIDNTDVSMIEQAGLLLAQVDQTAPIEELQANSVYLEYCGLIDQNIEITEPDQQTTTEETPAAQTVFGWLKALFTIVLNWLLRAF